MRIAAFTLARFKPRKSFKEAVSRTAIR